MARNNAVAKAAPSGTGSRRDVYSAPGAPRRTPPLVEEPPGAFRQQRRHVPGAGPIVQRLRPERPPRDDRTRVGSQVAAHSDPAPSYRTGAWRGWLGLAISVAFLALAFRGLNPRDVWRTMEGFDARWLPPALALYAVGVWLRAVRWSVLLRPVAPLSPRAVLPTVLAGYTANNILPLRTGELVRAYLLGRTRGVRKSAVLASIAVERLFDGLTMLGFLLLAMTAISPTAELRRLAAAAALLFAAVVAGLFVVLLGGGFRDRLLEAVLRLLPAAVGDRVRSAAAAFLAGLGSLRRGGDLLLVAATSLLAWGFEAAMYWAIAQGFGLALRETLTPVAALLTTGVANLATLVPAAPGYVGTFEAGVVLAVAGALGVGRALALSYALLIHAALWLPVTLVGVWCWWRLARGAEAAGGRTGRAAPRGALGFPRPEGADGD